MNKKTKETLLIFAAAVLVLLSAGLFGLKEKQKAIKKEAADKLDRLRSSLNKLEDDFKDKEKLRVGFEKRLDGLSRESASLEVQIVQIKKIYNESEEQLAAVEKDISSSQDEIKDLLVEKRQLSNKISSAESEVKELENRLEILKQTTAALERHLKKMMRTSGAKTENLAQKDIPETIPETKIIIEPIITTPASQVTDISPIYPEERSTLEGEVLVVNREFNFMVISLGKQDGLNEGDRLTIYDGDKLLGEVFVETVRENISAASGGKDLDAYRIRPGNKVYKKGV